MIKGLFQVKSSNGLTMEGTAFAVERISEINKYYIVTAYHVISEIVAKGGDILLTDEDGHSITAVCTSTRKSLAEYENAENDYAVLESFSDRAYEVYNIKAYTEIGKSTNCSIEGAIAHFEHPFTPFTAIYNGPVKIRNEYVLFITSSFDTFIDRNGKLLSTQDVLKGVSGAPVTVHYNGKEFCIGIVTQVGNDYLTPVKYAVPIVYAVKSILDLDKKIDENELSIITARDYLDAIFDSDFEFSDDTTDKQIWNRLSNAHFRGGNIDKKLKRVIFSDDFKENSAEIQCAVLYYYARLLFKRGRIDEARSIFNRIEGQSKLLSEKSNKKVTALVKSRGIVEDAKLLVYKPRLILDAADMLEKSLENPDYKAYEMASVFGKGIMNLFQEVSDLNKSEKDEVLCIYYNQKKLHEENPEALKKQEVVITSVEWLIELWNVSNNICMDDIDNTIAKGFIQAQRLSNNIFHIQCLLSMVVSMLIREKITASVRLFYTSSKLMHKLHITFRNEGISQLIKYIQDNYYPHYLSFMFLHNNIDTNINELFPKLETFHVEFDCGSWKTVLEESLLLYNRFYEKESDEHKTIQPYEVAYSDLVSFYT